VSGAIPVVGAPAGRRYPQQLARRLKVAGNLTLTLAVIGPAASVFAIGSLALGQQGSGAFLALVLQLALFVIVPSAFALAAAHYLTAVTDYAAAVTFASLTVVLTFALIALSGLASRLRQPGLIRPYHMPLWPLPRWWRWPAWP
jgi:amino acid transporter